MTFQSIAGYWKYASVPRFVRAFIVVTPIFFYLTVTAWEKVHFGGFAVGYFYIVILLMVVFRSRFGYRLKRRESFMWAFRIAVGVFWAKTAIFILLAYVMQWPDPALLAKFTYVDVMSAWVGFQLMMLSYCSALQLDIPSCAESASVLFEVITYTGAYLNLESLLTHFMLVGTASFLTLMVMLGMVAALTLLLWPCVAVLRKTVQLTQRPAMA